MEHTPRLFVEEVVKFLGYRDLKQLVKLTGSFGDHAGTQMLHRFDLAVDIYLRDVDLFSPSELGVCKCWIRPTKKIQRGESALTYAVEHHRHLSKLIIDFGMDRSKHASWTPFGEDFLKELSKFYSKSRTIQLQVAGDCYTITDAEIANLHIFVEKLNIPQVQPNLEVKIDWVDKASQPNVLKPFLELPISSLQLTDEFDYLPCLDSLVNLFYRPSLNTLVTGKDIVLPPLVERWLKSDEKYLMKFYSSFAGAHFIESETFFRGFKRQNVKWTKSTFHKSVGKLKIPGRLCKQIDDAVSYHGGKVCRLIYKKHPKLANYYLCLLFVANTSEIQSFTDVEDTVSSSKLKKHAEKMKDDEFAQCSEGVCMFFCEMK
uniref:F-box domain-containing protein n=1 Tax=Steinernema glaseri TaxID=37863 RepID=A0A1I8AFX5_9BILA